MLRYTPRSSNIVALCSGIVSIIPLICIVLITIGNGQSGLGAGLPA